MNKLPVNRSDIVDTVAEQAEISKVLAARVVSSVLDAITSALKNGGTVSIPSFGGFSVKVRAARMGRNPKTGEPIQIKAANVPVFKPGKALKDAVNSTSNLAEEQEELV